MFISKIYLLVLCILFFSKKALSDPSFPEVPCSKDTCRVSFQKIQRSENMNNQFTTSYEFTKALEYTSLIQTLGSRKSEIYIEHSDKENTWTLDSLISYTPIDKTLKPYIEKIFENIGKILPFVKYKGYVPCLQDFGATESFCRMWSINAFSIEAQFYSLNDSSDPNLYQMSYNKRSSVFQFDWTDTNNNNNNNNKKKDNRKNELNFSFKVSSEILEFPDWWSKAMAEVHMLGFDGGNSVKIDDSTSIWVFGDSMLNKSVCNRNPYAQGLSNSLMFVQTTQNQNQTKQIKGMYFPYEKSYNNCGEMFLYVTPELWKDPYDERYWPGGGITKDGIVYVQYGITSSGSMTKDIGSYIAKAKVSDFKFDISDRTRYPFFNHVIEIPEDQEEYYYFFAENDISKIHVLLLSRVQKELFLDPSEYEVLIEITDDGAFNFGKVKDGVGKNDGIPLINLMGMNPQQSVRYNKFLGKFILATVSSDTLYFQISDDLLNWSQQIPVYENQYLKEKCSVYCPYLHPELNSEDDSVIYITLSMGASSDCPVYKNQIVKISFDK